jgi:general secretion pathway protein L
MAQKIVGIDLGSYSVKAVTIAARGKGPTAGRGAQRAAFDVLGFGEEPVRPPGEGEDAAATLRERQGEALQELRRRGALEGDVYVTGLPGDAAAAKTLTFPFVDRAKIVEALPFTLEDEIAIDLEEVVYSHVFVEGVATRGRDKGAEVLCVYARKDAVQEVLDQLAISGVDPRHVELDALALSHLWDGVFAPLHGLEHEGPTELRTPGGTVIETVDGAPAPCTALVDIGHRHTTVCVLAGARVVSAHTLLHGGADATRALARELSLPLDEAERGKRKEAFVEVTGAVAQFPEQQQISDVLKRAYAPVVRRLRQIFQATISTSRLRVVKVVLTGGGSKVLNLERHLAEELNIKVVRGTELNSMLRAQRSPLEVDSPPPIDDGAGVEAALAFAYALSALSGGRVTTRVDLRIGPFAWKGDYDFLRERMPALTAWAAALLCALGLGAAAQAVMLSREETALLEQQLKLCQEITGEKTDSTSRCLALIQERINGTAGFQVPEMSATDTFLEISRRLPYASELKRKITELDITSERVRLKGTTTSYDAIDTMVGRLQGGRCFELVEKGKARNINAETIEMNMTINLDCAKAPGDGKTPAPPPGLTAEQLKAATSAKPSTATAPGGSSLGSAPYGSPASDATASGSASPPPPPPPPMAAAAYGEDAAGLKRPTASAIEERRERLKKLREERELRRKQLITNPLQRQNIRERFGKPAVVDGSDGDN